MKENPDEGTELQDILLDIEETKNNKNLEESNNLSFSKLDVNDLTIKNESDMIISDISFLKEMGYDRKMINKVYIFLNPPNIETAIDIMTPINNIYQHNFYENIYQSKNTNKNLCFICNQPRHRHIKTNPDGNDEIFNNNIIIENNNNIIINNISNNDNICKVCFELMDKKQLKLNSLPCGHICCNQCWMNYLKSKILEAKVEQIECFEYQCNQILSEQFILDHIKKDNKLLEKYKKFKLRAEILNDPNKRQCPEKNCDKYLTKGKNKYVKCENGHKYCFKCLRPWHGEDSCEKSLEKDFLNWKKKNKNLKRCPKCKIYIEKNEGCNHMTCSNCKFQWCWLCEGEYNYGHYDQGKCKGFQFSRANNIEEARIILVNEHRGNRENRGNRGYHYERYDENFDGFCDRFCDSFGRCCITCCITCCNRISQFCNSIPENTFIVLFIIIVFYGLLNFITL